MPSEYAERGTSGLNPVLLIPNLLDPLVEPYHWYGILQGPATFAYNSSLVQTGTWLRNLQCGPKKGCKSAAHPTRPVQCGTETVG